MGFPCDICGSITPILEYRRRHGDVVCLSCLDEYGCAFRSTDFGDNTDEFHQDGPSHPKQADEWEGGD